MKKDVIQKQEQWMTPELLKEMFANPNIKKAMSDPIFMQVFYSKIN